MKLYLSGADTQHQLDLLIATGCKYFCFSFSNLKRHSHATIAEMFQEVRSIDGEIFLDPNIGWISNKIEAADWNETHVKKYIDSYIYLIESLPNYIDVFASLDIKFADYKDVIDPLRSKCEELANKIGNICVITPTTQFPLDDDFFSRDDLPLNIHIGIDVSTANDLYSKIVRSGGNRFIKENRGFHAWGVSSPDLLTKLPLASANSNSWTVGARYGSIYDYPKKYGLDRVIHSKTLDKEKTRIKKGMRRKVEKLGIDYDLFLKDDSVTLNHWNASLFVQFQTDLYNRRQRREAMRNQNVTLLQEEQTMAKELIPVDSKVEHPETGQALAKRENQELSLKENEEQKYLQYKKAVTDLTRAKGLNVAKQCNSCDISDICPLFQNDSECRLQSNFEFVGMGGLQAMYEKMLAIQMSLMEQQMVRVNVAGEGIETAQNMIEQAQALMSGFQKLLKDKEKPSLSIKAKGEEGLSVLAGLLSNIGRGSLNAQGTHTHPTQRAANKIREKQALEEREKETNEILDAEFEEVEFQEIEVVHTEDD